MVGGERKLLVSRAWLWPMPDATWSRRVGFVDTTLAYAEQEKQHRGNIALPELETEMRDQKA